MAMHLEDVHAFIIIEDVTVDEVTIKGMETLVD